MRDALADQMKTFSDLASAGICISSATSASAIAGADDFAADIAFIIIERLTCFMRLDDKIFAEPPTKMAYSRCRMFTPAISRQI